MPVVSLLVSRVPSHVLEAKYGLVLPSGEAVTSERLLTAYGTLRGFMTAGGRPDQARATECEVKAEQVCQPVTTEKCADIKYKVCTEVT